LCSHYGDKAEQLLRYRHGNLDKKTGKYLGTYPEEYGGNDYCILFISIFTAYGT